jgi:hypothetical protein
LVGIVFTTSQGEQEMPGKLALLLVLVVAVGCAKVPAPPSTSADPRDLIAKLKDPDKDVRSQAVDALKSKVSRAVFLDEDTSLIGLVNVALNDPDLNVRRGVASALVSVDGPGFAQPFTHGLFVKAFTTALGDPDPVIRGYSLRYLGRNEKPLSATAVAAAIASLSDPDTQLRRTAVQALAGFPHTCWPFGYRHRATNDPRAVDAIAVALRDRDPTVRGLAALGLCQSEDVRIIKPLADALNDSDNTVRFVAGRALLYVRMPLIKPAILTLKEALRRRDLSLIAGDYSFFIESGVPDSENLLIDALSNPEVEYSDEVPLPIDSAGMATAFLNSGNDKLKSAGSDWAASNHYFFVYSSGESGGGRWGSAR